MNIKKIQKYILAFSSGIAVLSLIILLFLYFHGYNAWNPIVQWIMYFFVFGIGISCSTSIYLISSFFGELKEKKYQEKFSKNIFFWLKREKFGYNYEFSKNIFDTYKEFPTAKKSSIEKLEYLRECIKQKYSFKELKMWKLYFDMKRDSMLSITMIISTLFSFSFISFILQQIPNVYDVTLQISDSIPLAIMYSIACVLIIASLLFGVWASIYVSEKNYRIYYPIICSILEEYERKRKRRLKNQKNCHTLATNK